ncbi:MAG: acyl-CoA thioesterase [Blastocatellia bacterium]|nr:acyl-CoA thioesterase [Blastocatellia bacterium]
MSEPKTPATDFEYRKNPAIRTMMMPHQTNAYGTIFGGVILSYIDLAGAVPARDYAPYQFVTVAMKEVIFHEPVYVGDIVSFYGSVTKVGRTSITVHVLVEANRMREGGKLVRVTEADVIYVAIGDDSQPTPIIPNK